MKIIKKKVSKKLECTSSAPKHTSKTSPQCSL